MPLINPDQPAPDFSLPDASGRAHGPAAYAGRPIVLYFYPKDDTPGCTDQACQFRDLAGKFEELGAVVLGVSPDDERSHARFAEKFDLPFALLADVPGEDGLPHVCNAYGVWQEKSMYGKKYMGVVRTTYLIDRDGNVSRRWDKVKVPGHGREVLEAVEALASKV